MGPHNSGEPLFSIPAGMSNTSGGKSKKISSIMPKGMMLWMLVLQILLVGGASLSQATPTTRLTPAEAQSQSFNSEGTHNDELSELSRGLQRTAYSEDLKNEPPATQTKEDAAKSLDSTASSHRLPLKSPVKNLVKRSTNGLDGYMTSGGYDPMTAWSKKNEFDPGYDSYMHSIQYNPMMAWGKRQNKRNDPGYDSYMQSIGYNPMMAWGKRNNYDLYLQSVGYDPMSYYAKKTVKRSSENPSYYPHHLFSGDMNPNLDVFIPNHYMHNLKRSISPYLLTLASNDWKRAPNDMGAQGFHEGIFTHNFGDFSPVKRGKREAVESSAPAEEKRRPEMTSSDFNGDTFSGDFGDFSTMKKRRLGMGASGFHGDTFSNGFGDPFSTMKKRMGASGFYGDTFNQGFGDFSTMKKRRMGMGASGFHGDTFSNGFGDPFSTMKKRMGASGFYGDTFNQGFGDFSTMKKRRMGMGASGFHGDTFSNGFGDPFSTMKKRMGASGFYGDTFNQGFGDFSTMKKRRMGMGASGFHGDTFSNGFGDPFSTMKKRMGASGFYGDTFNQGFGDFSTMKKKMGASGFHGDTFNQGFGDFSTMKKRMGASGFHGDTFNQGFGDFSTMKKRRLEMDSSGIYGDTFNNGFGGDFYTMKRAGDEPQSTLDDSGFYGESVSEELSDFNPQKKNGFEEVEVQETEKEKESLRRKRDIFQTPEAVKHHPDMDTSGFYGDTFSDGFGDFYAMKKGLSDHDTLVRQQQRAEEGRPKRSLEGNDALEVEMKPPYERDLGVRNQRSIQEAQPVYTYTDDEGAEDSQDIYKRSIDGSNPFYEGFEDLNAMNGWR